MNRIAVFASVVFVVFASACGHSGDGSPINADGEAQWGALPVTTPATYTRGSDTILAQAVIDSTGGTLSGPTGSALEGVIVSFPPGAVAAPTTFSLGQKIGGSFAHLDVGVPSDVIVLNSSGQTEFPMPITISYPYVDPVKVPVPFYLRPDGRLILMHPLPVDRASKRAGFLTWHASDYFFANVDPTSPPPVQTGFSPVTDGLAFSNLDQDEFAPFGRCVGISKFTKWYSETHGSGLFGRFGTVVPKDAADKVLTGEAVLATRAHTAAQLTAPAYAPDMTTREAITHIMTAIRATGLTQVIGISERGGGGEHALLAVAYSDNQIAVYDSNHPAKWKAIDYVFDPADKPSWEFDPSDAWVGYGTKHAINIFGDWPPAEGFSSILTDAEAQFHGQSQTKVEITSHQNGDTVNDPDITVTGKIHSGQILISEAEVWVEYETSGGESERQTIHVSENDKTFSVPLKMLDGKNRLRFTTRGRTVVNSGLAEIRNDLEKDADKFVLNYGIQGGASTFTLAFASVHAGGASFTVSGDVALTMSEDGTDLTNYDMNGTARISPEQFPFAGALCTIDQPEVTVADQFAVTVVKGPSPALRWFYAEMFQATCVGASTFPLSIMVDFRTATGQTCLTFDPVPLTDPKNSTGTYTCTCGLCASQPTTATWDFDLDS